MAEKLNKAGRCWEEDKSFAILRFADEICSELCKRGWNSFYDKDFAKKIQKASMEFLQTRLSAEEIQQIKDFLLRNELAEIKPGKGKLKTLFRFK